MQAQQGRDPFEQANGKKILPSIYIYNGIARDQIYHVADETWQCTKKWGVSAVSNGKIQQA